MSLKHSLLLGYTRCMSAKKSVFVFIVAFIFLVFSLVVYVAVEPKRIDVEFFRLLESGDEEKLNKFITEISNKNFQKYVYFSSLIDYFDGRDKEAVEGFLSLISNGGISEKELGISKFIVGYYLLFEKNDMRGMSFILSPESYKYFSEYVNYFIGLYNFERENYDEALKFFLVITNSSDENMRKSVLARIAFIELVKDNKVSKEVKDQLKSIDKDLFYNLIKE